MTYSYARRPEMFATIKEVVSAKKRDESEKRSAFFSENGIPVSKPILVGMVESKSLGEKASTISITDGGRDIVQVTAFGEDMPMVEGRARGDWILVFGVLRHDDRKRVYYIIPNIVETIERGELAQFTRFWFLQIAYLRMLADARIPAEPCKKVLQEEGIPFEETEGGWIEIKRIEPREPQRKISRSSGGETGSIRERVLALFRERGGRVDYADYLQWASENGIKAPVAESALVELTNDGVIGESEDHSVLEMTGEV
jgi:hypothetical protein